MQLRHSAVQRLTVSRMTAIVVGVALLAATSLGVAALNEWGQLPFIGDSSEASMLGSVSAQPAAVDALDQNACEDSIRPSVERLFLERETWAYSGVDDAPLCEGDGYQQAAGDEDAP